LFRSAAIQRDGGPKEAISGIPFLISDAGLLDIVALSTNNREDGGVLRYCHIVIDRPSVTILKEPPTESTQLQRILQIAPPGRELFEGLGNYSGQYPPR
jgi:hypothetical protein